MKASVRRHRSTATSSHTSSMQIRHVWTTVTMKQQKKINGKEGQVQKAADLRLWKFISLLSRTWHTHFNHKHKRMKPKANQTSQRVKLWTWQEKTASHLSIQPGKKKKKKRVEGHWGTVHRHSSNNTLLEKKFQLRDVPSLWQSLFFTYPGPNGSTWTVSVLPEMQV